MEKRVLNLELVLEQNTKLVERLDRTMAHLTQSVADLRVQMIQGHAELRQEITKGQSELRQEIAADQAELRQEIAADQAEFRKEIERKSFWLITAHYGALLTLIGFLGKHFIDTYFK